MISDKREYRAAQMNATENEEYIVEGYASTFDEYVLYTDDDGTEYKEKIDARAFDAADLSDVIFLYNHEGRVYARQRNKTLEVNIDDHGLHVRADLSKSADGRELYNEIKSGLIDQMSFAFTVREDEYNKNTHTRNIKAVAKVFDVSAVSIPANDHTTLSARNYFDGVIEAERAERRATAERAERIRKILIILGGKNE